MRLKDGAAQQGIHYQTAWPWFRDGKLPLPSLHSPSSTILVQPAAGPPLAGGLGLYAERPATISRPTLTGRQPAHPVGDYGTGDTGRVEAEVASATTGRRARLRRLLADSAVQTVVVTHPDRLAWMNAELVEAARSAYGRRLMVLDDGEATDDVLGGMVQVLTGWCARLSGRRSAHNRALQAVRCTQADVGPVGAAAAADGDGDQVVG